VNREIRALSQEIRKENNVMDKTWYRNSKKEKNTNISLDLHDVYSV